MKSSSDKSTEQAIEIFLRLSLLILIMYWCFEILSPFILPVLWGVIIAVALFPAQHYVQQKLGNKQVLTSVLFTILMLAIIIVPASLFLSSLTNSVIAIKTEIENGTLSFNEPKEAIKLWPIIGERLYSFLTTITDNTELAFQKYQSEITTATRTVLNALVGTGLSLLQLLLSIVIAGVLLSAKGTEKASHQIMNKLLDNKGEEYVELAVKTIRNVVKGILGVAVIQSTLAAFGLYLANIPHAGIWILACLIFSIIQIGPGIILIPSIIYLYSTTDGLTASLWAIYFVIVLFSDNVLKPILLGKGASVPMLVIFLGVIGGFMSSGFIGLFTGAIVLSIGYKLLIVWMGNGDQTTKE